MNGEISPFYMYLSQGRRDVMGRIGRDGTDWTHRSLDSTKKAVLILHADRELGTRKSRWGMSCTLRPASVNPSKAAWKGLALRAVLLRLGLGS